MNVGVIGVGYWGPNLVRNCVENGEIKDVYACDTDPARLKFIHSKQGSVIVDKSLEEILQGDSVDAVFVALPVHLHYEVAKKAIEAGKHVVIEKPMTSSAREAEELIALAERKGVVLMVDHTFIYTPAVRKIKALQNSGEIGDLYYYDSVRVNLGLFQHDVNVVWDLAPHDLSIMDHVIGKKPKYVSAVGADHIKDGMEDVAYIYVSFDNGLIAHLHVNWMSPVKIRKVIVAGNKKMVVFDDIEATEKIKVYDTGVKKVTTKEELYNTLIQYRTGDVYIPNLANREALSSMISHFVDCVENGKKPITDGESGLNVVRILEATTESIKHDGKNVYL